jgi:DNA-binding NarL/FixJ family response regulator
MTTLEGLRVLIAEDETIIRLDLRQMLEEHGAFVCGEARDGLEAIELARTTSPDVGIFDVKMPNLDGVEAARRIYAEHPLPVVMLTAYSDPATIDRAIGAGVFSYLSKPFGPQDVLPAVRAAVDGTATCSLRAARWVAAWSRSRSRCGRAADTSGRCACAAGPTAPSPSTPFHRRIPPE